jgi:hypothetical protein
MVEHDPRANGESTDHMLSPSSSCSSSSGILRDESCQSLPNDIGKGAPFGKGYLTERLMLLSLDRREERHGRKKLLISGPGTAARRAGLRMAFSLHR